MAFSAQSIHSSNPINTAIRTPNKIDVHGVQRSSCLNCTECPQFIGIPGHVLCAYCGCPPARHGKGISMSAFCEDASKVQSSFKKRKRGQTRSRSNSERVDDKASDSEENSDNASYPESDSDVTSSGVSSADSSLSPRQKRRRFRPKSQVTEPPPRVARLLEDLPPSREEQLKHSWNESDSSPNVYVRADDPFTFHRNPVYQTTDAIRGKAGGDGEGYTCGLHVWKIYWPSESRGTHPVVGVATRACCLSLPGYKRLVGSTTSSWGWCLKTMKIYHDSKKFRHGVVYPRDASDNLCVPESFYMILDMDKGTLSFQVRNDFLGVAFSGLRGEELFPIVSAVWGHCEVSLTYMGNHELENDSSID